MSNVRPDPGQRLNGLISTVLSLSRATAGAVAGGIFGMLYSPDVGDSTLTAAKAELDADLAKSWVPEEGQSVYRVWDGIEAPLYGRYWTPVNPMMMQAFGLSPRVLLGLPNENTGRFLTFGRLINPGAIIYGGPAASADGNPGGAWEYQILNPRVNVQVFYTIPLTPPY